MNIKNQTMKILKKNVTLIVEKTDTGFSAYSEQYPVFTTAGNITELMNNTLEAVNLFFEEDGMQASPQNIRFEIDFKQFFQ